MKREYNDLVVLLARGISQRRMYFDGHPKVQACAADFARILDHLLETDGQESFFIGVAEGKLVHDGKYLVGPTIIGSKLADFADLLQCGGFLFKKGTSKAQLLAFFTLASSLNEAVADLNSGRALLQRNHIGAIDLSPPYEDAGWYGQFLFDGEESGSLHADEDGDMDQLVPVFQSLFDSVDDAHSHALQGQDLGLDNARTASERLLKASTSGFTDIMQMVRYPDYDTYTVGHSVRVAMFSVMVGRFLGLDESRLGELGTAGLMHDVGKAQIPVEILFKPGSLDAEERAIIETHPEIGARMLLESQQSSPLSIAVAWGHHRRFDGGGYPAMPLGSVESMITRIVHVCDVFEALTAIRPYKAAKTPRKALEIMASLNGVFCPTALTTFVRAVGLFPPGSLVKLTSGHQAVVLSASHNFQLPVVKLTHDPWGLDLPEDQQSEVDLSTQDGGLAVEAILVES